MQQDVSNFANLSALLRLLIPFIHHLIDLLPFSPVFPFPLQPQPLDLKSFAALTFESCTTNCSSASLRASTLLCHHRSFTEGSRSLSVFGCTSRSNLRLFPAFAHPRRLSRSCLYTLVPGLRCSYSAGRYTPNSQSHCYSSSLANSVMDVEGRRCL